MSKRACRQILGVRLEQHRPEVAIIRRRDGSGKLCMFVFDIALLRTKLHFGLLHVLDIFEVGCQLCQSPTSQPVRMLNALVAKTFGIRSLDAIPFPYR